MRSTLRAWVLGIVAWSSGAQGQTYPSVALDGAGQLSIAQASGTVVDAPRLPDQVSCSQPRLSADHRTIAWLANYADPSAPRGAADPVAGRLVVYRAGRILRTYATDQVFWSWRFVHRDRDVAFCTGPTHGGADTCELRGLDSGRLQAKWNTRAAGGPPYWARGLTD